jgi:hypothetical protein
MESEAVQAAREKATELGYDLNELTVRAVAEKGVVRVMFFSSRKDRRGDGLEVIVDPETSQVTETRHYQ